MATADAGSVEVLNFGTSGHGGHQAFRILELEGSKYDLDYILFGPSGFQINRDLSFKSSVNNNADLIKGRYILKNDSIIYISPYGRGDIDKRFSLYNRFPLINKS